MAVALAMLLLPGGAGVLLQNASAWFLSVFGGLTLLLATACVVFCFAVAFLPQGRQCIGGEGTAPQFGVLTWIAMMFAAGMGAGLVFWGAAEPLIHAGSPPPGEGLEPFSDEARQRALGLTQFHWGVHAWAIYAAPTIAVALSVGKGRPPLPSTAFPRLPAAIARTIDLTALLAVVFGLVASLGQGVFQVSAGLSRIIPGAEEDLLTQVIFLAVLSAAFLGSTALGLRKGIAVLSNINMVLAGGLLLFLILVVPWAPLASAVTQSLSAYATQIPALSVNLREAGEGRVWTEAWTLVYFLWWVAWTPFVGVFLVRISRGRSLRAFVLAAVGAPAALSLVWFAVFGAAGFFVQTGGVSLGVEDFASAPLATYSLLEQFPLAAVTQVLTVVLVATFLVTSADSGAYVIAMFAEEDSSPTVAGRLFFGVVLAALTLAALLSKGGQDVTRALAVAGGIPLVFLVAAQIVSATIRLANRAAPPQQ
jgi:choline-glycine betaine transporter